LSDYSDVINPVVFKIARKFCQGATTATEDFQQAISRLPQKSTESSLLVFDFSKVDVVTASYLKGTVYLGLLCGMLFARQQISGMDLPVGARPLSIFVAVKGCKPETAEEINEFFAGKNLPILSLVGKSAHPEKEAQLLGEIDPLLKRTLILLYTTGDATAADLAQKAREPITLNGWNNRLADIYDLRLAARTRSGKFWIYSPLAERII
jgi:hypothetical protein